MVTVTRSSVCTLSFARQTHSHQEAVVGIEQVFQASRAQLVAQVEEPVFFQHLYAQHTPIELYRTIVVEHLRADRGSRPQHPLILANQVDNLKGIFQVLLFVFGLGMVNDIEGSGIILIQDRLSSYRNIMVDMNVRSGGHRQFFGKVVQPGHQPHQANK